MGEIMAKVEAIDLFCGVGGLTRGLSNVGVNVLSGFDNDKSCEYAYSHNNSASFETTDVRELKGTYLSSLYGDDSVRVLVGCAPCQPFSQMRSKLGSINLLDEKYNLLSEFGRLIQEVHPDIISMENVPQLCRSKVYEDFISLVTGLGYKIEVNVVNCADYGISQNRRRFIMLGSLLGNIHLLDPTHKNNHLPIEKFIRDLPPIKAGEICETDKLHRAARLSDKNLERIKNSRPGGSWRDWPDDLKCRCHRKASGKTYSSVYGRLQWDKIGPTITTQFYSYGTGRHGHPEQDRALSLREGALLQTFPMDYDFINPNVQVSIKSIARHIGNAVPVRLGEVIGESIIKHLNNNEEM